MGVDVHPAVGFLEVGFTQEDAGGGKLHAEGVNCVNEAGEGEAEDAGNEALHVGAFIDAKRFCCARFVCSGGGEVVGITDATVGLCLQLVHDGYGVDLRAFQTFDGGGGEEESVVHGDVGDAEFGAGIRVVLGGLVVVLLEGMVEEVDPAALVDV